MAEMSPQGCHVSLDSGRAESVDVADQVPGVVVELFA